MTTWTRFTDFIYFTITLKIVSFFMNIAYLVWHIGDLTQIWHRRDRDIEEIRYVAKCVSVQEAQDVVHAILESGDYHADKWINWEPRLLTWYARMGRGDCDDAARVAHKLLKYAGVRSSVYYLLGGPGGEGHAVCLTADGTVFSNEHMAKITYPFLKCRPIDRLHTEVEISSLTTQLLHLFPNRYSRVWPRRMVW